MTNGGTVVRIALLTLPGHAPIVASERVIANGFPERTSEAALVVGPTGDGLGPEGTLYVADTQGNRIAAIPGALFRQTPLGGGGITVAKGGFQTGATQTLGFETDAARDRLERQIEETVGAEFQPFETEAGEGGLFGLAVAPNGQGLYFVDDSNNTLQLLH